MDCRLEPAARTFARIELLSVQGFLYGLCRVMLSIVAIPIVPFAVAARIFGFRRNNMRVWTRIAMLPVWLLYGAVYAVCSPFGMLVSTVMDIRDVAKVEWRNRWTASVPKMPDGHPARILSAEEREFLDMAVTIGVIRDYNEEAKQYGQGVDINPRLME